MIYTAYGEVLGPRASVLVITTLKLCNGYQFKGKPCYWDRYLREVRNVDGKFYQYRVGRGTWLPVWKHLGRAIACAIPMSGCRTRHTLAIQRLPQSKSTACSAFHRLVWCHLMEGCPWCPWSSQACSWSKMQECYDACFRTVAVPRMYKNIRTLQFCVHHNSPSVLVIRR